MKAIKKTRTGKLEWICAEASEIQVPGVEGMTTRLRVWLELPTDLVVSGDTPAPGEALPPIDESLRRAAWQLSSGLLTAGATGTPLIPTIVSRPNTLSLVYDVTLNLSRFRLTE